MSDIQVPVYLDGGSLRFWCGVCGQEHHHGAGADPSQPLLGSRISHCVSHASPLFGGGGYELILIGGRPSSTCVRPNAPFVGRHGLGDVLSRVAFRLQHALISALLKLPGSRDEFRKTLRGFDIEISGPKGGVSWSIRKGASLVATGRDLLSFLALGFAVSDGMAFVIYAEQALRVRFDTETAAALVTLIDAWAAAGRPARRGRCG